MLCIKYLKSHGGGDATLRTLTLSLKTAGSGQAPLDQSLSQRSHIGRQFAKSVKQKAPTSLLSGSHSFFWVERADNCRLVFVIRRRFSTTLEKNEFLCGPSGCLISVGNVLGFRSLSIVIAHPLASTEVNSSFMLTRYGLIPKEVFS